MPTTIMVSKMFSKT